MRLTSLRTALLCTVISVCLAGEDSRQDASRDHWAWRAPTRPKLPVATRSAWANNAIDTFIVSKLEAAGIEPAAAATREQLIRRATLGLIGLPPTPVEIDAFLQDSSPNAWEKVVDRLLASPHYGERWGRHWLDLARFAESNGYEFDEARPDAWRYRDYVIASLNFDKPYNRFVQEQLAGDELWPGDPQALIATGFNLLGPDMTDASDQAARRQNTLNDMTDTAGLVLLGMTLACARCHDHKFEPIPQADYYRLQAFFTPAQFRRDLIVAPREAREAHEKALKRYLSLVRPIQEQLTKLEERYRARIYASKLARLADEARAAHQTPPIKRTKPQWELVARTARLLAVQPQEIANAMSGADKARVAELQEELRAFDGHKPAALPVAMGLSETGGPPPKTFVLERGELSNRGDEVLPGFPSILVKDAPLQNSRKGRRAALAHWITRPDNALTARVLVNRLWQHQFGRGIVRTASDFGVHGDAPTHAELLDWLAVEFVEAGWSIKRMHKLMLLSATYQQSTTASPAALAKDPTNQLFSRQNRARLEGEIIRDSLLAVSGRLNRGMGGPGVFPPLSRDALRDEKVWPVSSNAADHVRRSVYVFARRNLRFPFLEAFDLPDSNLSCPKRERSTTAPQALALLNSADVAAAAAALADRLQQEAATVEERIVLACRLSLGRRPSAPETQLAREFLKQSPLSEFCRALLNVNEFVYVD
jgi:hypothetical protein